jgi:hypothetical protein
LRIQAPANLTALGTLVIAGFFMSGSQTSMSPLAASFHPTVGMGVLVVPAAVATIAVPRKIRRYQTLDRPDTADQGIEEADMGVPVVN